MTDRPRAEDFRHRSMRTAVQALSNIARHEGVMDIDEARERGFEKYARELVRLGLVKATATSTGTAYEITESGSRFLEQYEELERDASGSMTDYEQIRGHHSKEDVTVVIPTLNEAEGIRKVIEEVKAEGYDSILVVDGYSSDQTPEIADTNGAVVVYQHGNGKAGGVRTAIERVETPYLLFMDGDHTYDPKDIWRLVAHIEDYNHIIGVRDRKHIPRLHRLGNWVISQFFSLLFLVKVTDVCSGMYLLRTEEVKKHIMQEPGFAAEVELAAQSASNETLTEVPISYRQRIGTKKLSTWKNGLAILSAVIGLSRRHNPILLYSGLASLSLIPALAILGWVAEERLVTNTWHAGWVLVGIMLLLVAAQAFTLASVSILTKHMERRLMQRTKRAQL